MDKPVIDKIEQLVLDRTIIKVDDITYTPVGLKPVIFNPLAAEIVVHSLSGFCDFISHDIDKVNFEENQLAHVIDHGCVMTLCSLKGLDRKRESLILAKVDEHMKTFPFGKFMSQEEFAVSFRSMFEPKEGDDTEYVLNFTSSLVGGTQITSEEDGITQTVKVKRGVSGTLKEDKASKPIVKLSPYRTFREIKQPQSEFLFRIRLDSNDNPQVALFEADGGKWIHEAMVEIASFISARLPELRIIA